MALFNEECDMMTYFKTLQWFIIWKVDTLHRWSSQKWKGSNQVRTNVSDLFQDIFFPVVSNGINIISQRDEQKKTKKQPSTKASEPKLYKINIVLAMKEEIRMTDEFQWSDHPCTMCQIRCGCISNCKPILILKWDMNFARNVYTNFISCLCGYF